MASQRILFEVHKTYKQALEDQSKPFFDWLEQVRHRLRGCLLRALLRFLQTPDSNAVLTSLFCSSTSTCHWHTRAALNSLPSARQLLYSCTCADSR